MQRLQKAPIVSSDLAFGHPSRFQGFIQINFWPFDLVMKLVGQALFKNFTSFFSLVLHFWSSTDCPDNIKWISKSLYSRIGSSNTNWAKFCSTNELFYYFFCPFLCYNFIFFYFVPWLPKHFGECKHGTSISWPYGKIEPPFSKFCLLCMSLWWRFYFCKTPSTRALMLYRLL